MTTSSSPKTSSAPRQRRSNRRVNLLVGGIVVVILSIPLTASLAHRAAVHALHTELGRVTPPSVQVVSEEIDNCRDGVGPASVRILGPVDPTAELESIRNDYQSALADRGFRIEGFSRATRDRSDNLDFDVVTFSDTGDGINLGVVADVFDTDMVICLPFG